MNQFTNKDFVHLHVHSDFSNFDGMTRVDKLVLRARKMGFPAIALTDHGNMGGTIKFIKNCYATKDKKGNKIEYPTIKPIVGIESYISRDLHGDKDNQPDRKKGNRHLILLAKNREGYKNLCRLQTISWREGVYYGSPRIDIDLLSQHSEGLICGSACLSGLVHANLIKGRYEEAKKAANIFKEIFGEDFYLEIQYHGIADESINVPATIKLGKDLNIPVCASNDSHYLKKNQASSQEVLMCMSTHNSLSNPHHLSHPYPEFYLKSAQEMAEIFGNFPETLYNTVAISERIDDEDIKRYLFDEGVKLFQIDLPEGYETSFEYLIHLAKEGMRKRGWDKSKKHIERLKMELTDVKVALDVNDLDFPTYFLIVRDYINWAKENDVMVNVGRGSGYGSLLLHCLGICSGLDPIDENLNLLWQRFLGFDILKYFIYKDLGLKNKEDLQYFSIKKEKIKEEILNSIDRENHDIVKKELEEFEKTTGINSKNNLEELYSIWKNYEGEIGDKNSINSWTVYYLKLTNEKPSGDFLYPRKAFARESLPDIDSDFDDIRRQDVIKYIINKYGEKYAAKIGTYGTMGFRTAVARVVKALDIASAYHKGSSEYTTENMAKVNEILASIPKAKGVLQAKDITTGEKIKVQTVNDAMRCFKEFNWYMTTKYPEVKKHVDNIEGLIQSFTVHPAGVVVSSVPLDELVPQRMSRDGGLATQYPHGEVEEIGMIKFDILGVSTLTTVGNTLKLIKENYDIDIDRDLSYFSSVDDKATFETYRRGDLVGIFQCEEYGMQETIKKIAPTEFNDIMAAIALYRPGPLQFIPQYCDCKNGIRNIDYFHPSIEKHVKKLVDKTQGILIFQEQIMEICNVLAGFSITDGYVMIKAVGKKKLDLMKQFEDQFVDGCEKNDVPRDVAQAYWEKYIVPFAGYGFNKSHSAAYGYLSYVSCYLKTHYKEEFMVSLLNAENYRKKHELVEKYEKDLYQCGIKIGSKEINKCGVDYKIIKKADSSNPNDFSEASPSIMVKGNGLEVSRDLEKYIPYHSFRDFVSASLNLNSSISRDNILNLYDAGFLREFSKSFKLEYKQKMTRESMKEIFLSVRNDIIKTKNRGLEDQDLFS